jgi:hypothetical protein
MPFNFFPPASPTVGQVYSPAAGFNWVWNGNQWEPFTPPLSVAPATAGSFDGGSAADPGVEPIKITAVTPYRAQFSLVNNYGTANQVLIANSNNTASWVSPVPIASGGTNTTATPTAGAIAYGTGTAVGYSPVGVAGYLLTSGGAGAPVWANAEAYQTSYATFLKYQ